jgi:hypothetical protein
LPGFGRLEHGGSIRVTARNRQPSRVS